MATLELSGGTIAGHGTITISGLFTWANGIMCALYSSTTGCTQPTSNAITNANGGLTFTGGVLNGRTLYTAQTSTASYGLGMDGGAVINNQAGATWNVGGSFFSIGAGAGGGTFNNFGTFQNQVSTCTVSSCAIQGPTFNNLGTVALSNGSSLYLSGNGGVVSISGSGRFSIGSGSTLSFGNSADGTLTGPISGTGTVSFAGQMTLSGAANSYNITGSTMVAGGNTTFSSGVIKSLGTTTISNGTVDFQANNISVPGMTLSGAYAGTGTLTISGPFTWSYGVMCAILTNGSCGNTIFSSTAITNANGGMTLTGGQVIGRTLNTAGTSTASGSLEMSGGAVINNQAGATWSLTGSFFSIGAGAGGGTFNNLGTFQDQVSSCTISSCVLEGPAFNNMGAVVVGNGSSLLLSGNGEPVSLSGSGSFTVASGSTLAFGNFAPSTLTGSFNGAGTVNFMGGIVTLAGPANSYNITGATTMSGSGITTFTSGVVQNIGSPTLSAGTVDFQSNVVTVPSMTVSGGLYAGTGTLTINGPFTWSSGTMCTTQSGGLCTTATNAAATYANGGMTLCNGSSGGFLTHRTLYTAGTTQASTVTGGICNVVLSYEALINNQAAATWNVASESTLQFEVGAGGGTFNNSGAFSMSPAGIASVFGAAFNNLNSGSVNLGTGSTLNLCGPVSGSGSFAVNSGATLNFGSSGYGPATGTITGSITGSGTAPTVGFSYGSIVAISGPAKSYNVDTTGYTTVNGGTTTFSKNVVASVGNLTIQPFVLSSGGAIPGIADFQANTINVPTLNLNGNATNDAVYAGTGTLTVGSSSSGGTFAWGLGGVMCATQSNGSCTTPTTNAVTYANGGVTFAQGGGGVFNVLDGRTLYTGGTSTSGPNVELMLNDGAVITNLAGGTWNLLSSLSFSGGTFNDQGAFQNPGTANSESSFNNTVFNDTGAVTGTIALTGSGTYTQGSGGSFDVQVAGANQFDTVAVQGAATLAGSLNLTLTNGYTPPVGTKFTIITFGSESGTFASVSSGWSVSYNATSAVVTYNGEVDARGRSGSASASNLPAVPR
jgi:hypothetical protein